MSAIPKGNADFAKLNIEERQKIKKNSCTQLDFSMAFILLVQEESQATAEVLKYLNEIKNEFSSVFLNATDGMATMNTKEKITVIKLTNDMIGDGGFLNVSQISKMFYRSQKDKYDFLTIYKTFTLENEFSGELYYLVKNNIKGIGLSQTKNQNQMYGKAKRLRGINLMMNISNPAQWPTSPAEKHYLLLHEVGHNWCCYAGDLFSGNKDGKLEIRTSSGHYYPGLHSPYIGEPHSSYHWKINEDGTYSALSSDEKEYPKYHPFTLYFMGLMPRNQYSIPFPVYNAGIPGGIVSEQNYTSAKLYRTVSVNDIIKTEGPRKCFR